MTQTRKRSVYLVFGLLRLYRELGRDLELATEHVEKVRGDMVHVEHVIKLVEPDFNASTVAYLRRRKAIKFRGRGRHTRFALAVLKDATEPMLVADIATEVAKREGLDISNRKDRDRLRNSIYSSLKENRDKTVVRGPESPSRWSLKR
jgi:hypothetical protein